MVATGAEIRGADVRLLINVLIVAYLCFGVSARPLPGRAHEDVSSEVQRIVETIESSAKGFGYETVRGYRVPDEWDAEGKTNLLESHAYYTLFGKDSDGSCLTVEGRIFITILIFRDAESARHQVAQMKEYHLGNMGYKVLRSDEDGYDLEEINGFYAAVIQDAKVILFEDRSRRQGEVIKALGEKLRKQTP